MALLTDSLTLDALCVLAAFAILLGCIGLYIFTYWWRRRVRIAPGLNFVFGHFGSCLVRRKSVAEVLWHIYKSSTDAYIGIFGLFRPILFVRNTMIVNNILGRNFHYFTDRGVFCDPKTDSLSVNLFARSGTEWQRMREKLGPAFTTFKMRGMFDTILECGHTLVENLANRASDNYLIDIREIATRHTTDVIASVVFGYEINTLSMPQNSFRKYGRKIYCRNAWNSLRWLLRFIAPKWMRFIGMTLVDNCIKTFIQTAVAEKLQLRDVENVAVRKDLFQLLLQLRNSGTIQSNNTWDIDITAQKQMSEKEMEAEMYVFFAAGCETTATTISFCLYELAQNTEIQERVQEEIDRVLAKYDGDINYDSVEEMIYLQRCIDGMFIDVFFYLARKLFAFSMNHLFHFHFT